MDKRGLIWIENIRKAKTGDKCSEKWLYENLYRMYSKLTDDEDRIQELLIHFFKKVLPAFDEKYYPLPIIYLAAKRMLINLHKRNIRFTNEIPSSGSACLSEGGLLDTHINTVGVVSTMSCAEECIKGIDRIMFDFKTPEYIRVFACCNFNLNLIKMLNKNKAGKRKIINQKIRDFATRNEE